VRDSWLELVDSVLRPARPYLERCVREREQHLAARRSAGDERRRAVAACEARIEAARADVFSAKDGVVGARMTTLEREWRLLSRTDPDAGLMDLWARIAPPAWIDRKLWRGSEAAARLDAAIALAADPDGVDAAEAAIAVLRKTSATPIGPRIRWRMLTSDFECTTTLLGDQPLDPRVHDHALSRLPERPALARDLARAAFVDARALGQLWRTGYVLSALDASGVTIEIPPLPIES